MPEAKVEIGASEVSSSCVVAACAPISPMRAGYAPGRMKPAAVNGCF